MKSDYTSQEQVSMRNVILYEISLYFTRASFRSSEGQ